MLLLVTLTLQLATASTTPEAATLHVGIHRDAGTIYEIAADGAAGQCTTGPARLSCPARGAVRFRWAGDPAWQLTGQDEVGPGEVARAWVLAREELRQQDRRRLEPERVSAAAVRDLFGRDGAHQPPAPSRAMLDDLAALCLHEDLEVRKAAADGLMPWLRRTWADPLSPEAPSPFPAGLLLGLAGDPDRRVRVRAVRLVRDMHVEEHGSEGGRALLLLADDPARNVRRAALAAIASAPPQDMLPPEETWVRAMAAVPRSGPRGRSACNSLARLSQVIEPSEVVDPVAAVELVLRHHPERAWKVWGAWREQVPLERAWVDLLLRETLGLHQGLLRHWAESEPLQLADAIRSWEPGPPHSARYEYARDWLATEEHPAVRAALELDRLDRAPARPPPTGASPR